MIKKTLYLAIGGLLIAYPVASHVLAVPGLRSHISQGYVPHRPSIFARDDEDGGACPLSSPDDSADDTTFEEPDPVLPALCKRGGCFSTQNNLPRITVQTPVGILDRKAVSTMWNDAGRKGEALIRLMDYYVGRGESRQASGAGSQQLKFESNYRKQTRTMPEERNWITRSPELAHYWHQTNYPSFNFNRGSGWKSIAYVSTNSDGNQPTLGIAGHANNGIIVCYRAYADCDYNPEAARAYSSTLTWNGWLEIAGAQAKNLKYLIRLDVRNRDSNTIASIAHELYPQNVNFRGGAEGAQTSTRWPAQTGHGRWTPTDEAWPHLLAMPNVKPVVQMLVDYDTEMENPFIVAIHTFPQTLYGYENSFRVVDFVSRPGYIVVEFGPQPVNSLRNSAFGVAPGGPEVVQTS